MAPNDRSASSWARAAAAADAIVAPLAVFTAAYLGALFLFVRFLSFSHWAALVSVAVATVLTVTVWDRGQFSIGLFVVPRLAVREVLTGFGVAAVLIGTADILILLSTGMRHRAGTGLAGLELLAVFLPAAVHEELLFRGYAFQRLWRWNGPVAIVAVSALFAALHAWNAAVTPLALTNVFLGGIVLSLAYAVHQRLWLPIGLHFGWNFVSGPVLGYEVSGYTPAASLLEVGGSGPEILTGGRFGIEGSLWMTLVELLAITWLWRKGRPERVVVRDS